MKKLLILLGSLLLLFVIVAVIGIVTVVRKGSDLDKDSKAYVDSAVPAIVASWDEQELLSRASPKLLETFKEGDLDKWFRMFRKLGNLQTYNGSQGASRFFFNLGGEATVSANYLATAIFEHGPANIRVSLVKATNEWRISGFYIDSEAFIEN